MALLEVDSIRPHLFGDQGGPGEIISDFCRSPLPSRHVSFLSGKGVNGDEPGKTSPALPTRVGDLEEDQGF